MTTNPKQCTLYFRDKSPQNKLSYIYIMSISLDPPQKMSNSMNRVLKGGGPRGGGNWGTLRIPREDWGTLGNIRED